MHFGFHLPNNIQSCGCFHFFVIDVRNYRDTTIYPAAQNYLSCNSTGHQSCFHPVECEDGGVILK